ncbi:MAG: phage minor capsid protein [Oscillospiraceae bacterium]|nr:phage minor capsid protein [Oscillospiraceae bacterium]
MLTPKQLQSLPKPLTDIYSELSDFLLQDIALRISKAAKITDTAEYQMYRARALGMSTDAIKKEIARINGVAEEKIAELIAQAAEQSDEFDRKMLGVSGGVPLAENTQLQKLMAAQIEQTRGLCTNLTGTLGFAQRTADGRMVYGSATDFLRKQMDMAQMKVMTGVCDYNTAVRQACFVLADSGLRTVYYASGHSDRIEVAVRRALMTSVSQLTQKISEQNAAEFGANGWEISAHMGARPSHAVYQGRQYPNSQYETIVLPLITDYNCRHSAYPIIMGVTKPAYTDEQLAALDPPPFTYEGRRYTAYEAQQQMRKMERAMRRQKDRCVVADAVGDKDAFTAASIKLRRQKDYYEDFCKAAGTYTEYERTFVAGYNRQLAAKTGAVTRKQNAFKNAQISLTNSGKGSIIKEKSEIRKELERTHIEYRKVEKLDTRLSVEETISRVGGGDITKGSCSSVALAYIGNRNGLNVLDFRGGESTNFFSKSGNIVKIANLPNVKSTVLKAGNDIKSSVSLLKTMEADKEYFLATGKHAAIVKKEGRRYYYLELQDPKNNGFKILTTSVLKKRFCCMKSHSSYGVKIEKTNILIDTSTLKGNDEFEQILGYINTADTLQKKGVVGSVK